MTKLFSTAILLGVLLGGAAANASVVFSDNFDSDPLNLSTAPANWTVTSGTVDIIGSGGPYDFYPGNGHYIDLEGSTSQLGVLQTIPSFAAGTYKLTFNLGGIHYDPSAGYGASRTTNISLGSFSGSVPDVPFNQSLGTSYSFVFSTNGGQLVFSDASHPFNQNVGNILDNVTLTAVPEASTWAMLLIGFAGLGFASYRASRKGAAVAA